jgi:hypothetical protein
MAAKKCMGDSPFHPKLWFVIDQTRARQGSRGRLSRARGYSKYLQESYPRKALQAVWMQDRRNDIKTSSKFGGIYEFVWVSRELKISDLRERS